MSRFAPSPWRSRNDFARLAVAVTYVAAWVWIGIAQPGWSDFAAGAWWVASSVVTGALIGRWWAVGLGVAGAIGVFVGTTVNPCVERDAIECDVNVPALVFGYFMLPTCVLVAIGVAIRRGLERARVRGSTGARVN